ncbi:MAG: hypothetical protein HYY18_06635 [Planctomycetes bacterium]|nr:hypothetical protein [Planctomycetota bacterium]
MVAPSPRPASSAWVAVLVVVVLAWASVFSIPALAVGWFLLAPARIHSRPEIRHAAPTMVSRSTVPIAARTGRAGSPSRYTYTIQSGSGVKHVVEVCIEGDEVTGIEVDGRPYSPGDMEWR